MNTAYLIRNYPLVTIFDHALSNSKALQRLDLRAVSAAELADLSFFADRPTAHVYAAHDPLRQLPRTAEGSIKNGACIKVVPSQLRAILEALVGKSHRYVSQASLANLRTAPRFTSENRPEKPRRYSPELILQAIALKASGMSWANLAKHFQCNVKGLESACRKFSAQAA